MSNKMKKGKNARTHKSRRGEGDLIRRVKDIMKRRRRLMRAGRALEAEIIEAAQAGNAEVCKSDHFVLAHITLAPETVRIRPVQHLRELTGRAAQAAIETWSQQYDRTIVASYSGATDALENGTMCTVLWVFLEHPLTSPVIRRALRDTWAEQMTIAADSETSLEAAFPIGPVAEA